MPIFPLAADATPFRRMPSPVNNLFNRNYPLFEFVFAVGLLQAAEGSDN
jgi:hypothetical protein